MTSAPQPSASPPTKPLPAWISSSSPPTKSSSFSSKQTHEPTSATPATVLASLPSGSSKSCGSEDRPKNRGATKQPCSVTRQRCGNRNQSQATPRKPAPPGRCGLPAHPAPPPERGARAPLPGLRGSAISMIRENAWILERHLWVRWAPAQPLAGMAAWTVALFLGYRSDHEHGDVRIATDLPQGRDPLAGRPRWLTDDRGTHCRLTRLVPRGPGMHRPRVSPDAGPQGPSIRSRRNGCSQG